MAVNAMTVLGDILGTKLGPRGITLQALLGRKGAKNFIRASMGQPTSGEGKGKQASEPHPALAKLALFGFIAKAAALEKEAPFKSQAQRRKFCAMESRGEISSAKVREWERETPKGKKLPERVKKEASEKSAILGALPLLTIVPGAGKAARLARAVGWGSIPAGAAVAGFKQPVPTGAGRISQASIVDSLLAMTKHAEESVSVKSKTTSRSMSRLGGTSVKGPSSWHMRGRPGDIESAAEHLSQSGISPEIAVAPIEGSAHVHRPSV